MCAIWGWLKSHNESITSVAAILGVTALGFSYCELRDTREAVKSNTLYQIQSDGRTLLSEMSPQVYDYITGYDAKKTYDPELVTAATKELNVIVNYYASVQRQKDMGFVDDQFWATLQEDFCGMYALEPVKSYWDKRVAVGSYSEAFKNLPKHCSSS